MCTCMYKVVKEFNVEDILIVLVFEVLSGVVDPDQGKADPDSTLSGPDLKSKKIPTFFSFFFNQ